MLLKGATKRIMECLKIKSVIAEVKNNMLGMTKDQIWSYRRWNGKYLPVHQHIKRRKYKSKSVENGPRRHNAYLVSSRKKKAERMQGKEWKKDISHQIERVIQVG